MSGQKRSRSVSKHSTLLDNDSLDEDIDDLLADDDRFSDYSDEEQEAEIFGQSADSLGSGVAARRARKRRRVEAQ